MSVTALGGSPAPKPSRRFVYRHGLVGVSLSNTIFNRAFFRALFHWAGEAGLRQVDVVLFENLESINFKVFRRMDETTARGAAKRRGEDLRRMCERMASGAAYNRFPAVRVLLASEAAGAFFSDAEYEDTVSRLENAYVRRGDFYRDVRRQVMKNLKRRTEVYGFSFIVDNLDILAKYVLHELAFFYLYFSKWPETIELYPGDNLFVKEGLFKGRYEELDNLRIRQLPSFQDVSFLVGSSEESGVDGGRLVQAQKRKRCLTFREEG